MPGVLDEPELVDPAYVNFDPSLELSGERDSVVKHGEPEHDFACSRGDDLRLAAVDFKTGASEGAGGVIDESGGIRVA